MSDVSMDYTELKTKNETELRRLLADNRHTLQEVQFRVRRGEEKDVRRIREVKLEIARIETILKKIKD